METFGFFGQIGVPLMLGLGTVGSALGIGAAGRAAAGAWAKEGKEGKSLRFTYIILLGMPLSQTIYAFVLMKSANALLTTGLSLFQANAGLILGAGIACGLAELFSAWMQGLIGAAAVRCISSSEGKGLAFLIIAMGVVETVGLFAMIFLILIIPKVVA